MSSPEVKSRPYAKIKFTAQGKSFEADHLMRSVEFKGMANGGYVVKIELFDSELKLLEELRDLDYLSKARSDKLKVKFQLMASKDGEYPKTATKMQEAVIVSARIAGKGPRYGHMTFIGVDEPSWRLNMGDAAGTVWKGQVSKVIKDVVQKYAPGVNAEVSDTNDSKENKWWMMRQDPKTFITSLLDWSSSLTKKKTHWIYGVDGTRMVLKEQADYKSKNRALYRYRAGGQDNVVEFDADVNNALSAMISKLVTHGISSVSGKFFDRISDKKEEQVFVKDSNTKNKKIAKTRDHQSFTKPPDGKPPDAKVGWTSVSSIPEPSGGEVGKKYDSFIDGRPRSMWLNMMSLMFRMRLRVIGHGEWSDTVGLGVDTVHIRWFESAEDFGSEGAYTLGGNWIVYGFHHRLTRKSWHTDLFCSRFDYDSEAKKVGDSE